MKVLVLGATGGSGRAAVEALLAQGHEVTAFARSGESLRSLAGALRVFVGDAADEAAVARAVEGQDAVIVALGIRESAMSVRLRGSRGTPLDIRSRGTRHAISAMRRHGVRRLVVQTSYGVGETRALLPWKYKLIFRLLLRDQIADTEVQEGLVRDSGLDWVLAQPVNLTDAEEEGTASVSVRGETKGMAVSRRRVGRFLASAVEGGAYVGRTVALS
jgi:uncharacterized protein YbjT (DUF2867 family)